MVTQTSGKYYIVTIEMATNSPGEWSIKKIFRSKKAAKDFVTARLSEYSTELPLTEWDGAGPNWHVIEQWDACDGIITIAEIDNNWKGDK